MKKEIITFEKWYEREPSFATIFDKVPILNYLYPDACLTWFASLTPALTPATAVFEEAVHRFSQRYVYVPYLLNSNNDGQIQRIQADIMYQSISEWNRWTAIKELLNSQLTQSELLKLLGNYSITKEGGWTDNYMGETINETSTFARETGNSLAIRNFEGTEVSNVSTTSISTIPNEQAVEPSIVHNRIPQAGGYNQHVFDGGGSLTKNNYQEYGQKMGDLWNKYKDLVLKFPSAVDLFLTATAQAYLTDVYDTNMWTSILED